MTAEEKILALFQQSNDRTVVELVNETGVSKQLVHRILKSLVEKGTLIKLGTAPKTVYRWQNVQLPSLPTNTFDQTQNDYLKQHFLLITETGLYLEGYDAFALWCTKRKLPIQKTYNEFVETRKKYEPYYGDDGLIDGMEKIRNTKEYEAIYLAGLYYLDFYAIERFGKTKLGTILHYAKQGQNKFLMQKLVQTIGSRIASFLIHAKVDAVSYVPPTIKRETQLMHYLRNAISLNVPEITIQKISGIIPVPQKSLSKMEERITNANNTFAVFEKHPYDTVLLIDDAVGSGATLNQIAKKLLDKKVAKKVIGLAIVGSFKGFDVITDV
jgi:hypothetical protein